MITVTFPRWPTWNYHFPELDVKEIKAVRFYPKHAQLPAPGGEASDQPAAQEYPLERVRLVCGHNGVSGIVFKDKHNLPQLADRPDAVAIDYEE